MFLILALALSAPAEAVELSTTEAAMVAQLNAFRAQNGLPALKPAAWLMQRARAHCVWMTKNGMVHSGGIQENIAAGQGSVASVMRAWIGSGGHNSNMRTSAGFVGVAAYTSPSGTPYYVQQFGAAEGSPVPIHGGGGSAPVRRFFRFFRR